LEYWDLYDKNRKPLNKTHRRGIPLNDGEYHIAVYIVTINSNNQILTTHRSPEKEQYPDLWEITAGSAVSGESSECAALRELFEETGIKASPNELVKIGTLMGNTAFIDVYMIRKDIDITSLIMQPGETTEAKWVTFEQFTHMVEKKEVAKSVAKRFSAIKKLILTNEIPHN